MLNPNSKLDHYLSLAASATGAGAADLVLRATADPHLHVFSELLALPNIAALASDPSTAPHHALLLLFAHSTFSDYTAHAQSFPRLTPAHLLKLRTLSLVSLAAGRSSIPYAELVAALGLADAREMEEFVLDAGSSGLVSARLDQRAARVLVSSTNGRDVDVRPGAGDIAAITAALKGWKENSTRLLGVLDEQIAFVTAETARKATEVATAETAQKNVRDAAGLAGGRRGGGGRDMFARDAGFGSFLADGLAVNGSDVFEHIEGDGGRAATGSRRFDHRTGNSRSTRSRF